MDHLCYFCLVLLCFLARLFVVALWSPAGKGLTGGTIEYVSHLSDPFFQCDIVA